MKLALVKSDAIEDWYLIERAEHDGREWFEQTGPNSYSLRCSSRISDADIEGFLFEMVAIAKAINARRRSSSKRCAVDATTDPVRFWSPRNSRVKAEVPLVDALDLAWKIAETSALATKVGGDV